MEHTLDLVPVHLCSFLAPVGLLLLHAVLPGGFVGSPQLAFSLLSLLLSAATLLASHSLPSPRGGLAKVSLTSFLYAYLLSVLFYLAVGILLGANITSQFISTLVWASLMTSLTSLPTTLLLDIHWKGWIRVLVQRIFQNSAERNLYITFALTVLGAWLGAIPIPLDWNRPWQVWPIPCSCGAILGSLIGSASSLLAFHYSLFPPQLRVRQDTEKRV